MAENRRIYLVTGATGHVGNILVDMLVKQGETVRALVMKDDPWERILPPETNIVHGDVTDWQSLERFFSGIDGKTDVIVIHLAGLISIEGKPDARLKEVNVDGTKNIVEKCRQHKVKKLVYVSSVHAIPILPRYSIQREISRFDPKKVLGAYAKSKAVATECVLAAARRDLDATVVFPSGIVGPFSYGNDFLKSLIMMVIADKIPVGIRGGYDFVDARAVAKGIINASLYGRKGEGYILANHYVSILEIINLVREHRGKKPIKLALPVALAFPAVPFASLAAKLSGRKALLTAYALKTITTNPLFSHEKAERELFYENPPFEETMRDTVDWLLLHAPALKKGERRRKLSGKRKAVSVFAEVVKE